MMGCKMCLFMNKENCKIRTSKSSLIVMFLILVSVEMDTTSIFYKQLNSMN